MRKRNKLGMFYGKREYIYVCVCVCELLLFSFMLGKKGISRKLIKRLN